MPQAFEFRLVVEELGTTSHVRLMGEFDVAVVGRVENTFDRVFQARRARRVVVDLRRLTFLDAAGLATILRANERAHAAALELILVRPRGTVNRVFTLTRACNELCMVDDVEMVA